MRLACLLFLYLLLSTTPSFAEKPYFNHKEIGNCIIHLANKMKLSPEESLSKIRKRRKNLEVFIPNIVEKASNLGFWYKKTIAIAVFRHGMLHSLPFIPEEKIKIALLKNEPPLTDLLDVIYFLSKGQNISQSSNPLCDFASLVCRASFSQYKISKNENHLMKSQQASRSVSNPLTQFLLTKEPHSLTHKELLIKATEIYDGNVFLALGVIGSLFSREAENSKDRVKHAFLNNRLKPLLGTSSSDPVGQNYHYWGYLNNALLGHHLQSNIASSVWEYNDIEDRVSDKLGIDTGTYVLDNLNSNTASCE